MSEKIIDNLIINYLNNEATDDEKEQLVKCLENPDHKKQFKEFLALHYLSHQNTPGISHEKALKEALQHIRQDQQTRKISISSYLKYAAIFIVLLGIGYVYQSGFLTSRKQSLVIPDESITLQLSNGNIEIISQNGSTQIMDAQGNLAGIQKENQLVYTNAIEKQTLEYNTLTVPYGKYFEIQLSDGTHVHLNAGSSLKYPLTFIEDENRQVFLNGEAYFKVAEDTKHPFIVNANEIDIRVLGTQFNVSAYPEDDAINTVLVEGSVSIYHKDEAYHPETANLLKPGFKAAWEKGSRQITIEETDTALYTAWIHGKIVFRHMSFTNILKKLERHYNVVIINNNEALGNQYFAASFDVETIEQVLQSFNENHAIKYTIKDNQIIIN